MSPQLRALRHYEQVVPPTPVPAMRVAPKPRTAVLDARRLITVVVEAVDGRRQLTQLTRLLTSGALEEVERAVAPGLGTRLGRLRLCRVSPSAVEIAATLTQGRRIRALAARAELRDGAWKCTVFRLLP